MLENGNLWYANPFHGSSLKILVFTKLREKWKKTIQINIKEYFPHRCRCGCWGWLWMSMWMYFHKIISSLQSMYMERKKDMERKWISCAITIEIHILLAFERKTMLLSFCSSTTYTTYNVVVRGTISRITKTILLPL